MSKKTEVDTMLPLARTLGDRYAHWFKDGYARYYVKVDGQMIEATEAGGDGDLRGWVATCAGYVGSYFCTGPVARGGSSNITDDEFVTELHLKMDMTDPAVGSFTQADVYKAVGPEADLNGDVTRQWAIERLLKITARRPTEAV